MKQPVKAIRAEIQEKDDKGEWPVRLTFDTGTEDVNKVSNRSELDELVARYRISEKELVFRGRSFAQIQQTD